MSAYIMQYYEPASKKHCGKATIYFFRIIFVSIHINVVLIGENVWAILVETICCKQGQHFGPFSLDVCIYD